VYKWRRFPFLHDDTRSDIDVTVVRGRGLLRMHVRANTFIGDAMVTSTLALFEVSTHVSFGNRHVLPPATGDT
jgi:hypothetical protein